MSEQHVAGLARKGGHSCASESGGGQDNASRPGGDHAVTAATAAGKAVQGQGTAAICWFVAS
jgi:hypothetical protein